MGSIRVHEFISLDGVIDAPTWTFPFGFDPRMGEAIARATGDSDGILLGRTTYEMFAPAWSKRTVEEDPGAPFFNDTTKYVVSATLTEPAWQNSELIGAIRRQADPAAQGGVRHRSLRERQRHPGARAHRRRARRRPAPVRVPGDPVGRAAAVRREPRAGHLEAGGCRGLRQRRDLPAPHPGVVRGARRKEISASRSARTVASEGRTRSAQQAREQHDALGGEFPGPVFRGERVGVVGSRTASGAAAPNSPPRRWGSAPDPRRTR